MAELSTKKRNSEPKSDFGLPEERKYPMPDKSHARKRRVLKVDRQTVETIRTLQENPLRGEFRMHSKLKHELG